MTHTWENPSRSARHPLCGLETDRRRAVRVGHCFRSIPFSSVWRADVPDRAVDDRFDDATVGARPSTNESAARPTERRQRLSVRAKPAADFSCFSSAASVRTRTVCWSSRSAVGSRPARSRNRSFNMSSDRRSRTCAAGVLCQRLNPRATPSSGPEDGSGRAGIARRRALTSASPSPLKLAQRPCTRAVGCTSKRARCLPPPLRLAIAQPWVGASQVSRPSAAHSGSDGSVRGGRLIGRA